MSSTSTPSTHSPSPLVDLLVDQWMRPGYPFAHRDRAIERVLIDWQLKSGQWVMITAPDKPVLWGWQSWFRVTPETLKLFMNGEPEKLLEREPRPGELTDGPEVLIATTVVTDLAPKGTYRRLFDLTCAANADASHVSSAMAKRDVKPSQWYWMRRTLGQHVHRKQSENRHVLR